MCLGTLKLATGMTGHHIAATVATKYGTTPGYAENVFLFWRELVLKFETQSTFSITGCLQSLMNLKYRANQNPSRIYHQIVSLSEQLTAGGKPLDDSLLAIYLLKAIPKELDTIKQALSIKDDLTLQDVYLALQRQFEARVTNKDDDKDGALLAAKHQNKHKHKHKDKHKSNRMMVMVLLLLTLIRAIMSTSPTTDTDVRTRTAKLKRASLILSPPHHFKVS